MACEGADRILYIMRGCPGSGKTTLARELRGETGRVFSTDDFFVQSDGEYVFDPNKIAEYHKRNQGKARKAISEGVSPVVIDNTNTTAWEMRPYVETGLRHGYKIQFVEPDTSWRYDPDQLFLKNSHGVPLESIKRMLKRFQKNPTVESVLGKKQVGALKKQPQSSGTKKAPKKRNPHKSRIEERAGEDMLPNYSVPVPVPIQTKFYTKEYDFKIDQSSASLGDEVKSKPVANDIFNIPFMGMVAMVEKSFRDTTKETSLGKQDFGMGTYSYIDT